MMGERDNGFTYKDSISLKEFFQVKLDALALALKLAREQLDFRLEGMNHVQHEIREMKASYITRIEHEALVRDIQELKESRAELRGKASMSSVYISYVIAAISIAISIFAIINR